ncbi:MAG: MBOAT family protein [Clostridiales bacterium]|nr:MBOAT family protein [Clostridiales bacterium]
MTFASLVFLYLFLPLVLLAYYLLPRRLRNGLLLAASLLFYGWGEPSFLPVILFSAFINYLFGRLIERYRERPGRARLFAALAVGLDLLLLAVFKYAGFLAGSLAALLPGLGMTVPVIPLPLGISFYTFQVVAYVADVYRRQVTAQKSFVQFAAFMSFFPQLIAGPIVRYQDIQEQLPVRRETLDRFADGVRLLGVGLCKKVLVANPMGLLWETVKASGCGALGAWAGAAAFAFQIYFDFSGYSDMARGLGRLFGFELPENFRYPYAARSVTDFWRRWHITLSGWFRDYVYIPLGGSRRGLGRTLCNLLTVWALTGLWHGASWNFLLWGLYYFVLLAAEKLFWGRLLDRLPAAAGRVYTLAAVVFGWVLFAFTDFPAMGAYIARMFGGAGAGAGTAGADLLSFLPLLLAAGLASLPLGQRLYGRLAAGRAACLLPAAETVVLLLFFLLSTAALVSQSYNPFLYFRF